MRLAQVGFILAICGTLKFWLLKHDCYQESVARFKIGYLWRDVLLPFWSMTVIGYYWQNCDQGFNPTCYELHRI